MAAMNHTEQPPTCPKHGCQLICPACLGAATSKAKARASRQNGRKGGRPKGPRLPKGDTE